MDDRRDPDDLDLQRPAEPDVDLPEPELGLEDQAPAPNEVRRERFPVGLALVAALMLVGVGGLLFLVLRKPQAPVPVASTAPEATASERPAAPSPSPSLALPEAIKLPGLDESDALVRDLVARLSAHPQLAAWLGTDQLLRRFTVLVANVMAGENPRANLRFLEPKQRLQVLSRGPRTVIDPTSYARFDGFADALASLDEAGCARVYRLLTPLFEAAFRELGHPEGGFDRALAAAARPLLDVPVLEGDVALRPVVRATVVYEYADPRLEALSLPQKQLLRMGPRNLRLVQAKLRALVAALDLRPPAPP